MLTSLLRHAAFWVPFAATTYLAFTPNTEMLPPQITDVIAHASAFFYLTIVCWYVYYGKNGGLAPALWMSAYGIAIELIQSVLPARTFELKDLAVDAAGIAAALLVYRAGRAALPRGASKRGQTPL